MSSPTRFAAVMALAQIVSAQAPAAATGAAAAAKAAAREKASALNHQFYNYLFIICGSLAVAMLIWRLCVGVGQYIRQLTCMNNEKQSYFTRPSENFAIFKKYLLYAPIFGRRHNREFQLSSAVNVGTLPTRLQALFLIGYLATNVAFCVVSINWDGAYAATLGELRNRTGILAVVNMIPLFIMAGRNNILINWLNISFDTFNLLHRWFGRIVVLESIAHTVAWMCTAGSTGGWAAIQKGITLDPMKMWGFIVSTTNIHDCCFLTSQATVALFAILIQASSLFRHAFYETFKYLHIALVILVIIGIWYHLALADLPQLKLLYGVIAIWVLERGVRLFRVVWRNGTGAKAHIEALPGNACRVTVNMTRPWNFKAGQHAYLYMPTLGLWTSHPFSVAWSEEADNYESEKLAMNRQDILAMKNTTMSFVIRERTGFTKKLFQKAEASQDGKFSTTCFVEGPYGGSHTVSLSSSKGIS